MKIEKVMAQIEQEMLESQRAYKDRAKILAERVIKKMNEKTSDVDSAVKSYLDKGGKVEKLPAKKPRKSEKTDFSSKHIGGKGEVNKGKAGRIGKNAKTDPEGKPVVTAEQLVKLKKLSDTLIEQIKQLEEFHNIPTSDSRSLISGGHVKGCKCKEVIEGLRDPKDNPCWKGYKPVGTKKKGGRTVPNCVPKNEDVDQGKITSLRPGVEAEIDHGDGTKTKVDLKKNPGALTKDPTGKLVLNPKAQTGLGTQDGSDTDGPKIGDEVTTSTKESLGELNLIKRFAGLR